MFGDGHLDLPAVVDALEDAGYAGVVSVELPRHAHAGPTIAARCAEIFAALGADVRPR
jgi:sugar phosphate isomerase/epimerase